MKFNEITGTTKILGIMGYPVTYSLSPVMHNRALQFLGADYVYVAFPVPIDRLDSAIQGFTSCHSIVGFNLTIPHKLQILPHLQGITTIAQTVGAVNTVKRSADGWIGTNTDVAGFMAPLKDLNRNWNTQTAVILGSGGAAKAVTIGCQQLGIKVIHLLGRTWEKLQELQHQLPIEIHLWEHLPEILPSTDLLVNCTPIGMATHPGSPLQQIELLKPTTIVYDLIYTPRPTQLLQDANEKGITTIDGLAMLLHQGALALEFWLEQQAPIGIMAEALGIPNKT